MCENLDGSRDGGSLETESNLLLGGALHCEVTSSSKSIKLLQECLLMKELRKCSTTMVWRLLCVNVFSGNIGGSYTVKMSETAPKSLAAGIQPRSNFMNST